MPALAKNRLIQALGGQALGEVQALGPALGFSTATHPPENTQGDARRFEKTIITAAVYRAAAGLICFYAADLQLWNSFILQPMQFS